MKDQLTYELLYLWDFLVVLIKQIAPYWILGTVVSSFISVYLKNQINALVGRLKKDGFSILSLIIAAIFGVASPVCMFGTIPIVVMLNKNNLPDYLMAGFMLSSILLNPNLLFMTFSLGSFFGIIRLIFALLGGILGGSLVYIFYKKQSFFTFLKFEEAPQKEKAVVKKKNIFFDIIKSFKITGPYLILGILVTALFDRYFPKAVLDTIFLKNQALSTLFMASLGVPVYVCGGGTIPLLGSWIDAGLSSGSAVAFMVSGPATKITNIFALKTVLKTKNIVIYLMFGLIYSILTGFLTDFLLKIFLV